MTIQSLDLETLKKLLFSSQKESGKHQKEFYVVNMPDKLCHVFNPKSNTLEARERATVEEYKQTSCFQRRMMNILNVGCL